MSYYTSYSHSGYPPGFDPAHPYGYGYTQPPPPRSTSYGYTGGHPPPNGPRYGPDNTQRPSPPPPSQHQEDASPAYSYSDEEPLELTHTPISDGHGNTRTRSTREQLLKLFLSQGISRYRALEELDRRFEAAAPLYRVLSGSSYSSSSSKSSAPPPQRETNTPPPRPSYSNSYTDQPPHRGREYAEREYGYSERRTRSPTPPPRQRAEVPKSKYSAEEEIWFDRYLDLLEKGYTRSEARQLVSDAVDREQEGKRRARSPSSGYRRARSPSPRRSRRARSPESAYHSGGGSGSRYSSSGGRSGRARGFEDDYDYSVSD